MGASCCLLYDSHERDLPCEFLGDLLKSLGFFLVEVQPHFCERCYIGSMFTLRVLSHRFFSSPPRIVWKRSLGRKSINPILWLCVLHDRGGEGEGPDMALVALTFFALHVENQGVTRADTKKLGFSVCFALLSPPPLLRPSLCRHKLKDFYIFHFGLDNLAKTCVFFAISRWEKIKEGPKAAVRKR